MNFSAIFGKVNAVKLSVVNMTDKEHQTLGKATYNESTGAVTPNATLTNFVEVPVIDGSVTVNTGAVEKTEIKLINGNTWTSKSSKGDSDISFQIPAVDDQLLFTFFNYENGKFSLDVCKASGAVAFVDDNSKVVKFPTADIYAALVLGDGDNPAYINCVVSPTGSFDVSWLSSTNATAGKVTES